MFHEWSMWIVKALFITKNHCQQKLLLHLKEVLFTPANLSQVYFAKFKTTLMTRSPSLFWPLYFIVTEQWQQNMQAECALYKWSNPIVSWHMMLSWFVSCWVQNCVMVWQQEVRHIQLGGHAFLRCILCNIYRVTLMTSITHFNYKNPKGWSYKLEGMSLFSCSHF